MTDEQMDARLRAAGERWRTGNTAVAEPTEPSDVEITPTTQGHSRRRNWWAIASAVVVVSALVLGGILFARSGNDNGSSASNVTKLTGVTWTDPRSNGAVVFLDRTARITGSCGTTTHPLTINGSRLSIGTKTLGLGSSCTGSGTEPVQADQQAIARFLRIVHGPATWSIAADRLTLAKSGVGTITLMTDGAAAPQLVGTHWRLASYRYYSFSRNTRTTAIQNRVTGQSIDLHIGPDGHFVASDQCNVITGTASVGLDRVRFSWQPTCIDVGFSGISIAVNAALSEPLTYTVRGDQLYLSAHHALLTYRAVPATSTDPMAELLGSWRLETLTHGSPDHAVGSTMLTFYRNGEFGVTRGCPGFKAAFDVNDQHVTISRVTAAEGPVCPPNYTHLERQEDAIVDAVLMHTGTVAWAITGNQLAILRNGTQLTFVTVSSKGRMDLVGSWRLHSVSGSISGTTHGPEPLALDINGKGKFFVTATCPAYEGDINVGDNTATFTTTLVAPGPICAPPRFPAAEQRLDGVVASVLDGAVSWSVSGNTLTITKIGVGKLTFVKSN